MKADLKILAIAAAVWLALLAVRLDGAPIEELGRFGWPVGTSTWQGEFAFRKQGEFAICHCFATRTAFAVVELLDDATLAGDAPRVDCFAADLAVPERYRALLTDYAGSPYDRGHWACAGNYGAAAAKMKTFLLSNMGPQNKELNRGLWRLLESEVRPRDGASVWVITGPAYVGDHIEKIGRGVWVPTHCWKTEVSLAPGEKLPTRMRAWIMPNKRPPASAKPESYRVRTDAIETMIGADLWNALPDELEDRLEADDGRD